MKLLLLLITLISLVSSISCSNIVECDLCNVAVNHIEGFLLKNQTVDEIQTEMEKFCTLISPNLKPTCDSVVSIYTKTIIDYIVMKENPSTICLQLQLCNKPSEQATTPSPVNNYPIATFSPEQLKEITKGLKKEDDDSNDCKICQMVASNIIVMCKQNKTESEIQKELDKVCMEIRVFGPKCQTMVQQYLPLIMGLIESESPLQICEEIKLCSNHQSPPKKSEPQSISFNPDRLKELKNELIKKKSPSPPMLGRTRYTDTTPCTICKMITSEIIVMVKQNKTDSEIISDLVNICKKLPGDFPDKCVQMVDDYLPEILKIIQSQNPDQICQQIKLCSSEYDLNPQNTNKHHNLYNRKPINQGRITITKNI